MLGTLWYTLIRLGPLSWFIISLTDYGAWRMYRTIYFVFIKQVLVDLSISNIQGNNVPFSMGIWSSSSSFSRLRAVLKNDCDLEVKAMLHWMQPGTCTPHPRCTHHKAHLHDRPFCIPARLLSGDHIFFPWLMVRESTKVGPMGQNVATIAKTIHLRKLYAMIP